MAIAAIIPMAHAHNTSAPIMRVGSGGSAFCIRTKYHAQARLVNSLASRRIRNLRRRGLTSRASKMSNWRRTFQNADMRYLDCFYPRFEHATAANVHRLRSSERRPPRPPFVFSTIAAFALAPRRLTRDAHEIARPAPATYRAYLVDAPILAPSINGVPDVYSAGVIAQRIARLHAWAETPE